MFVNSLCIYMYIYIFIYTIWNTYTSKKKFSICCKLEKIIYCILALFNGHVCEANVVFLQIYIFIVWNFLLPFFVYIYIYIYISVIMMCKKELIISEDIRSQFVICECEWWLKTWMESVSVCVLIVTCKFDCCVTW